MGRADCANHRFFMTREEAERPDRIKIQSLGRLLCSCPLSSAHEAMPRTGNEEEKAGLCLADLKPIAGFTKAADERGGGRVREMSVIIRGLGGRTKVCPCWVSAGT